MPDKLQHLLEITDDASQFSEEHVSEALQDPETAEDYAMMVLAAQAFEAQKGVAKDDEAPILEMHTIIQKAKRRRIQRMAAIILTLFLMSGLAVAALLPVWKAKTTSPKPSETTKQTETVIEQKTKNTPKEQIVEQPAASVMVFQDEPLEFIMQTVCNYYQMTPVFQNEEVKQLRLYLKWNRQDGIDVFLERLSQFEKINVTKENNTIIIK
ncbi:MAG: DUF4974 domain-containing protein [Prevotella sp.]|nr:DUF4974 domain-containing protein [Prevotella sp.]